MISDYLNAMRPIEVLFANAGDVIRCSQHCSSCCTCGFEISSLDRELLFFGLKTLAANTRQLIRVRTKDTLRHATPSASALPCPLLDANGACRIYPFRPQVCRLHGLPIHDNTGTLIIDGSCELNATEMPTTFSLDFDALNGEEDRLYAAYEVEEQYMTIEEAILEFFT